MPNLFLDADYAAMRPRIEAIDENAVRQWGKMNVGQMLAHCQVALRIALGEQHLKRGLIGILFGGMARRSLLKPSPFGRNMPTAPEFKVTDERQVAAEKAALLDLFDRFHRGGPEGLTKEPHPFFGRLAPEEWSTLQWKHLDHHLRQFGV